VDRGARPWACHVLSAGLSQSQDSAVWRHADAQAAVLITKDDDFAEWIRRGRPGPQVVWLRLGNSSKLALLRWLEPLWPLVVRQLELGERLVEVR